MDVHTKKQRSRNMAAIRSRGNESTEIKICKLLKSNKIKEWRRHYRINGIKPDFVFSKLKKALFIDGCFWHGCPKCYIAPKNNKKFWKDKILLNKLRDKKNNRNLSVHGWGVLRIWEHEILKRPDTTIKKVVKFLKK